MTACTILVLGHLPSADNLAGRRSRDQDVAVGVAAGLGNDLRPALPLLRAWAQLAAVAYAPSTRRHAQSARLTCDLLRIAPPTVDPRLDNVDYGRFKGRPLADTPPARTHLTRPYPGGTSWADVAERWVAFGTDVLRRHAGETVLLAGQSGAAARMLEVLCAGRPLDDVLGDPALDVPFLNGGGVGHVPAVWRYRW